jgi:hypothetical protein
LVSARFPASVAPLREHFGAAMGVPIHPDRQAAMVNDDGRFLKSIREVGEIGQLVMEHPGVEAETARRQMTKARPKCGVKKQTTWWPPRHIAVWSIARVIIRRLPDTAKAVRRELHCAIEKAATSSPSRRSP